MQELKVVKCPVATLPTRVKRSQDRSLEQAFIRITRPQVLTIEGSSLSQDTVVVYSRRIKRVTLTRYLVSKLVWLPKKVNFQDLLVLFDNQLWLEGKAVKDLGFNQKFGSSLEELSNILKSTQNLDNLPAYIARLSEKCKRTLEGFYLPVRNLPGVEKHVRGLFHLEQRKPQGILKKHLPPPKVIGVGYSDKGTRRDPAYDGSPHWTDVAVHFIRKEPT